MLLRFDVPDRVLDSRFRHFVAADWSQQISDLSRIPNFFSDDEGSDEVLCDVPGGVGGFGIVERIFGGGDLAPAVESVHTDFD